ncbi:GNAT family N-acetyltransferase [Actinosynnema sp. NPDC023587]|uniref:GNAT family N-acetyltransferase n=1 Tax=Actinosynnema sp. NPDC023587 TaxID=3154695 RepID=UPI0033ED9B82
MLRETEARDRAPLIELFSSPEVGTYIGGPRPRAELERAVPEVWGRGYAAEACAAALDWPADVHPGEPVALCTQSADARALRLAAKLGFTEVERFEAFGAEQWFGVRSPVPPTG